MRALLIVAALLAAGPAPLMVLAGDGVRVGAARATFGRTPKAQATALVAGALGPPVKQGSHGDCGGADIQTYATFRGGFELSFVHGRLVGWTEDGAGLATDQGVRVGQTLAAVRRAYPDIDVEDSDEDSGGLGAQFGRDGGPDGWLAGKHPGPASKVLGLWSGQTCIAG
ncbi:hypothetical protein [Sphingomonas bacterium]|uniref:hypothetical protein n=1 Tax=Sphingomonas bacterium TaxID=1895847 RepID=UPI0015756897|nr:hypothetical protein [Sphingomonas bacterium]